MVSKQTRIWIVEGKEVQFDFVRFNHLFKIKAHESGIGITKYEEVLADALLVDSSTIHNWRFNLNGPSDAEKVSSLEEFWKEEKNSLLREVVMSKAEVSGLTDRELAALRNVYVSFKTFLDFFLSTNGFDKDKCEWEPIESIWEMLKSTIESEYIDLKKKLYDALYEFIENNLNDIVADAYFEHNCEEIETEFDDDFPEFNPKAVYDFYMTGFKKIVDPYLLA